MSSTPYEIGKSRYECGYHCPNPTNTGDRYFNKLNTYMAHMQMVHNARHAQLEQEAFGRAREEV
jgi:hypothetical protein